MLMHRAPRSAGLAVCIALVLASALPLFPTAAMAEPGQPRASTDASAPSGLVVVIPNSAPGDRSSYRSAVNNQFISGVAYQIHWSDIEPVQGKPD